MYDYHQPSDIRYLDIWVLDIWTFSQSALRGCYESSRSTLRRSQVGTWVDERLWGLDAFPQISLAALDLRKRRFALRASEKLAFLLLAMCALPAVPTLPAHHAHLSTGIHSSPTAATSYHPCSYSLSLCSRPPTFPDPNFLHRLPTFVLALYLFED